MTMKATELAIAGAWVFEPRVFPDRRGRFPAPYQAEVFREALGYDLHVAQVPRASRLAVWSAVCSSPTSPG
jgi:dTDP-4-dehydrorhamnose 3,5-epimerase